MIRSNDKLKMCSSQDYPMYKALPLLHIHSKIEKTNKMPKSLRQMFLSFKIVENKQQQNDINSSFV